MHSRPFFFSTVYDDADTDGSFIFFCFGIIGDDRDTAVAIHKRSHCHVARRATRDR